MVNSVTNTQKAKTINLLYRMVNSLYSKHATITRNVMGKKYDINKFEIEVSLICGSLQTMKELVSLGLWEHDFRYNEPLVLSNDNGVKVFMAVRKKSNGDMVLNCRVC